MPLPLRPSPVGSGEQCLGRAEQEGGDLGIALRRLQSASASKTMWGGDSKPRGAEEGEEFEDVEARQFGIAQPLSDQGCVEQDDRGFGGQPDRFAA